MVPRVFLLDPQSTVIWSLPKLTEPSDDHLPLRLSQSHALAMRHAGARTGSRGGEGILEKQVSHQHQFQPNIPKNPSIYLRLRSLGRFLDPKKPTKCRPSWVGVVFSPHTYPKKQNLGPLNHRSKHHQSRESVRAIM